MSEETIKVVVTLKKLDEYPPKFPCFCVPFWDGHHFEYRWEHAGVVDSLIRGAAHYFEIIKTEPQ